MSERSRSNDRKAARPRADVDAAAALVALRRIVRYLRLADREVETACGISVAGLFVLHQLADSPSLSIAELAERTLTDPSSVSTVVARLVDEGHVARAPSKTDRRRVELSLTAKGRRIVLTGPKVPQTTIIAAIREMTAERRGALVRSLEGLATVIGANAVEPRMLFDDEAEAPATTRRRKAKSA